MCRPSGSQSPLSSEYGTGKAANSHRRSASAQACSAPIPDAGGELFHLFGVGGRSVRRQTRDGVQGSETRPMSLSSQALWRASQEASAANPNPPKPKTKQKGQPVKRQRPYLDPKVRGFPVGVVLRLDGRIYEAVRWDGDTDGRDVQRVADTVQL